MFSINVKNSLSPQVEELRKKLETKEEESAQLLYVNMANERRISELSTRVASNQAALTVDGGDQRRRDQELDSARAEVIDDVISLFLK
jgi:uncharacterized membrane protein affecting hemolysin expression